MAPYLNAKKNKGRCCQLNSADLLGLVIWLLKTKGTMFSLCPIFGIVPSSMSTWLDFSLEVMSLAVERESRSEFVIRWPTDSEMKSSADCLQSNRKFGKYLSGGSGTTDRGRMVCADYTDPNLQNAYFEGFTQNIEVTNLFVWIFHGELIHTAVHFPGSWHDSKLSGASGLYYPKLSNEMTPPGFAILRDSAFVNNTSTSNGKVL